MSETTRECGCDVSMGRQGLLAKTYKDSAYIFQCALHKAAPEMLEALKGLVNAVERSVAIPVIQAKDDSPLGIARAAIAKAEGKCSN